MKKFYRDFLPWVEKQDPDARYDYVNSEGCPFALYLRSRWRLWPIVGASSWGAWFGVIDHKFPPGLDRALAGNRFDCDYQRHTYGELAERLRMIMP